MTFPEGVFPILLRGDAFYFFEYGLEITLG